MELLSTADWAKFRQVINNASATFNNELIEWKHLVKKLDYFGDDRPGNKEYISIPLLALIKYNDWNVLPVDRVTDTGTVDKNTLVIILNRDYLRNLNYLDQIGNFNFNPDYDRFYVKGIAYKCLGDTHASQSFNDPLLIFITCLKDEQATGGGLYAPFTIPLNIDHLTPLSATEFSLLRENISEDTSWPNLIPPGAMLTEVVINNLGSGSSIVGLGTQALTDDIFETQALSAGPTTLSINQVFSVENSTYIFIHGTWGTDTLDITFFIKLA